MTSRLSITDAFEKWAEDLTRYGTVLVGVGDAVDAVNQAFANFISPSRWDDVRNPRG